jgi:hypothetical protein
MRPAEHADLISAAHASAVGAAFDDTIEPFTAALDKQLRAMTRRAVAKFIDDQPRGAMETAVTWMLPVPNRLLDAEAEQADIATTSAKYTAQAGGQTAAAMAVEMGVSLDLSNSLIENVIASQKGMHIVTAPHEMIGEMMISLQDSYDKGLSIPHAAKAMRNVGYIHGQKWAERIARTELLGTVNEASLHMVTSTTNVPYKIWMTAGDNRVRPHHREAEGQTVPVKGTFTIGGYHLGFPGDPSGPGDEVIMCRCTMGYSDDPLGGIGSPRIAPEVHTPGSTIEAEVPATWGQGMKWQQDAYDKWKSEATNIRRKESRYNDVIYDRQATPAEHEAATNGLRRWHSWDDYIGSGHRMMNAILRGAKDWEGKPYEDFGGKIAKRNEDFAQFIKDEGVDLTEDVQMWRGTLLADADNAGGIIHEDPAFLSASLRWQTSSSFVPQDVFVDGIGEMKGVLLRLHVPKGTRVIAGNDGEAEYVLEPGTRYLVVREEPERRNAYAGVEGLTPDDPTSGRRVFTAIAVPPGAGDDWARAMLSKLRADGLI